MIDCPALDRLLLISDYWSRSRRAVHPSAAEGSPKVGFVRADDGVTWLNDMDADGNLTKGPWQRFVKDENTGGFRVMCKGDDPIWRSSRQNSRANSRATSRANSPAPKAGGGSTGGSPRSSAKSSARNSVQLLDGQHQRPHHYKDKLSVENINNMNTSASASTSASTSTAEHSHSQHHQKQRDLPNAHRGRPRSGTIYPGSPLPKSAPGSRRSSPHRNTSGAGALTPANQQQIQQREKTASTPSATSSTSRGSTRPPSGRTASYPPHTAAAAAATANANTNAADQSGHPLGGIKPLTAVSNAVAKDSKVTTPSPLASPGLVVNEADEEAAATMAMDGMAAGGEVLEAKELRERLEVEADARRERQEQKQSEQVK